MIHETEVFWCGSLHQPHDVRVEAMFDGVKVTWLGHGTFVFETPEGKKILVDPWLQGNPSCPEEFYDLEVDAMLITHGHNDHIGDVFTAHERCNGPIVGIFDLTTWLGIKGVPEEKLVGMNIGGRKRFEELDIEVRMTRAVHSSSFNDNGQIVYLGEPVGYSIKFSNGKTFYFAGDTALFGDMALIAEFDRPEVAILPIGDFFTMDPEQAAHACKLLKVKHVIPGHFGTFGALTGTPDELADHLKRLNLDTRVIISDVGSTIG